MNRLRQHIRRLAGIPSPFDAQPALESIYRDLFLRELARLDLEDRFFPVGGAANYSLLYLILRVGLDFQPRRVLDIGAGQSSLLWDLLKLRGFVGEVVTIESDPAWGERIAAQVWHEVYVTPLVSRRIAGQLVKSYDWDALASVGFEVANFDVVVCDGPTGTSRNSRLGVLPVLEHQSDHDVLLILDDAERMGEQDTVRAVHDLLQARQQAYRVGVVRAAKTQILFARGSRFVPATFL